MQDERVMRKEEYRRNVQAYREHIWGCFTVDCPLLGWMHAWRTAQLERIAWMRKYFGAAPPSLWAPFIVQVSGSLKSIN